MAKLAKVTYGTQGDTDEYTYVVNDNARTGDWMRPSVKHYVSGRVFSTTGIIQGTANENSVTGKLLKQEVASKGKALAYSASEKELGISSERGAGGKFEKQGGLGKTVKEGDRYKAKEGVEYSATEHIKKVYAAQSARREIAGSKNSGETFAEYSRRFLGEGN